MAKKQPKKPKKTKKLRADQIFGAGMATGKLLLPVNTSGAISHAQFENITESVAKMIKSMHDADAAHISTRCPNCNLKLVIPAKEAHRCILCGHQELEKKPYIQGF